MSEQTELLSNTEFGQQMYGGQLLYLSDTNYHQLSLCNYVTLKLQAIL